MAKDDYVGHHERQNWLHIDFFGEALDKLVASKVKYSKELKKCLKYCRTYTIKSLEEFQKQFPAQFNTLVNEHYYYSMLLLPKDQAKKAYEKFVEQEYINNLGDPIEQLYDGLDVMIGMTCSKCNGIEGCKLKEFFERYKIPEYDSTDEVCKYRYIKEGVTVEKSKRTK